MADEIKRVRENLEVVYDDMVKLLSSDPNLQPRYFFESELRAAWYALLAARESLDRINSALHPGAVYPPVVLPSKASGPSKKTHA